MTNKTETSKVEREYLQSVWTSFKADVGRELRANGWEPKQINQALKHLNETRCAKETPAQTASRIENNQ